MQPFLRNLFAMGMGLGLLTGCQWLTSPSDEENRSQTVDVQQSAAEMLLKLSSVPPEELSCAVPPENLVGWWSGDGVTDDYSGYDHHGTLHGNMTIGAAYAGEGFLSESEASYMEVAMTPELLPDSALTVEAWIKLDQYTYYPGILSLGNVETFEESFSLFISPWGNVSMLVNGTASSGGRTMLIGPVLPSGQWFHVVGVYNGSQIQLYVNGNREVTKSHTGGLYPAPHNLFMGVMEGEDDPLGRPSLKGILDEVSLYTRALSAAEISELYNAGSLGKCRDEATLSGLRAETVIQDSAVLESMDQIQEVTAVMDEWAAMNPDGDSKTEAKMTAIAEDIAEAEASLAEMVELQSQLDALMDPENPGDPKTIDKLEKSIGKLEKSFNKDVDKIQKDIEKIVK